MASKKSVNEHFIAASERVKGEMNLKTDAELFRLLGIPQSTFSRRKNEQFPAEWAYELELKTGLTTRWIMTGAGPKRTNETGLRPSAGPRSPYLAELEAWAIEVGGGGPTTWMETQIDRLFPDFKAWREKKTEIPADQDKVA